MDNGTCDKSNKGGTRYSGNGNDVSDNARESGDMRANAGKLDDAVEQDSKRHGQQAAQPHPSGHSLRTPLAEPHAVATVPFSNANEGTKVISMSSRKAAQLEIRLTKQPQICLGDDDSQEDTSNAAAAGVQSPQPQMWDTGASKLPDEQKQRIELMLAKVHGNGSAST